MNVQKFAPSFLYERTNESKEFEIVQRIKNYKISKLIETGSYRKAYKTATNVNIRNAMSSRDMIDSLRNLHPDLNTQHHTNEEKSNAFTPVQYLPSGSIN